MARLIPGNGTEQRQLATILFTDVMGSRALRQRDETRTTVGRRACRSVEGWNFQLSRRKR